MVYHIPLLAMVDLGILCLTLVNHAQPMVDQCMGMVGFNHEG